MDGLKDRIERGVSAARRALCALLLGLAMLVTAVAPVPSPAAAARISLGNTPDIGFMMLYVAMSEGFYKAKGIEVAYQPIPGGAKVNQALVTGAINVAGLGTPDTVLAYLAKRPVRIAQALYTHEFIELMVREQLRDKVRSVRDLKGLKIGVSSPGSVSWTFGRLMLSQAGLNPATDASFVFVGAPTTMYTALRSGKIDAAAAWEPLISTALAEHQGYLLASLLDPNEHRRVTGSSRSLALNLVVRTDTIASSPGVIRGLVAANRDAITWIRGHSPAGVARALAQYFPGVPLEILTQAVKRRLIGLPKDGGISEAEYDADTRALVEAGVLKNRAPFQGIVDCAFAGCRH